MRRALAIGLALALIPACRPAPRPAGAPSPAPTETPAPEATATPPAPVSASALEGGWSRLDPSGGPTRQSLVLRSEGGLGVLGIPRTDGRSWRVEGDTLILVTSAEPAPEPREQRLRVELAAPDRLVLSGPGLLAGAWERRRFAELTGTVTYLERVALTPEALVQIELRDVSRADAEAPLIAKAVLRPGGKQVPIPFVLDYDVADIDPRGAYAVSARIADRGQLAFVTETPVPVLTGGALMSAEIVVVPVR